MTIRDAVRWSRVGRSRCLPQDSVQRPKQFADTSLRAALPSEQEAQVRLSIATMFVLPPDVRIENARAALALSGLSDDLRAWLEAVVLHNLVVGGYIDAATAAAPGIGAAVEGSSSREARYALDLALGGLAYQQQRFDDVLAHLDASARRGTTEDVRARLAEYFRFVAARRARPVRRSNSRHGRRDRVRTT